MQQLRFLEIQLKTNKEYTCRGCYNKFKVKQVKTFTCDICQQEINGKMLEGHVENYQLQGISPRKWSKFCQNCRDTKIILANIIVLVLAMVGMMIEILVLPSIWLWLSGRTLNAFYVFYPRTKRNNWIQFLPFKEKIPYKNSKIF